ncbi:MAG TPA: serine hydrolase domain-containing protein [Pseudomonadales bacterium]
MRTVLTGIAVCLLSAAALAAQIELVHPSRLGFDAQRLERLPAAMHAMVDRGELSGIVTLVARDRRVVHFQAYGRQDLESGAPMALDTIFRIYSMTKPVTGVAMMMLYEQGKWHPNDPIARHIPEFANLKVFAGTNPDGSLQLVDPAHAPTMGELMSHTAGFTYGLFGDTPVDKLYREDNPLGKPNLQAFIERMAQLPLLYQPGTRWVYSVSVDIQGYLVEKLSGQSLPEFMADNIFRPLGMVDTAFNVPEGKLGRLATVYAYHPTDGLAPRPRDANVTAVPGLASGGGGLYSTAHDYFRFAQMLAGRGEVDEIRILAPATVDLMRANHLSDELLGGGFGIGWQRMRPGFGFGYDVAVFTDPHAVGSTTGQGTYLWDGAAGTWFWIDPTNDVVFIGMIQRLAGQGVVNIQSLSRQLVHQALVTP